MSDRHWRPWYSSTRWLKLRSMQLKAAPLCAACDRIGRVTAAGVVDHVIPHRGDPALFWDAENLQSLCKPCHDAGKQKAESAGFSGACDASGWPVDPRHPANGGGQRSSGGMSHPSWFKKVVVPFTVVCGPPGAGKSTYVAKLASLTDAVVCLDTIIAATYRAKAGMRPSASVTPSDIADALRVRNDALGFLMRKEAERTVASAWLIASEPLAEHRLWWANVTGARVVVLATPADECKRRVRADAFAGDVRGDKAIGAIDDWWRSYSQAPCDITVYQHA